MLCRFFVVCFYCCPPLTSENENSEPVSTWKRFGFFLFCGQTATPEMVYHCRCKLTSFLPKYHRRNDSRRDNVTGEVVPAQSYEEWYEGKKKRYSDLHLEAKPVTMQSISNVKSFNCETLDGAKQRQLQNAHKRLLMTAAKQRPGVEVGRVFDTNMKPLTNDIEGKPDGHSVKLPDQNVPYIAIHTHPACGIFSHGDIFQFAQNDNLKLLTAIGHNGHIYAIKNDRIQERNCICAFVETDAGSESDWRYAKINHFQ